MPMHDKSWSLSPYHVKLHNIGPVKQNKNSVKLRVFSYLLAYTYVLGAQKSIEYPQHMFW